MTAPTDAQTLFEIGSITKTVTALALAVLVEAGTVRLDTPLRAVLPEGTDVPRHGATEITLEHLARHTSGLPRSPTPFTQDLWVALVQGGNPYGDLDEDAVLDGADRAAAAAGPRDRTRRPTPTSAPDCSASPCAG